MAVHESFTELQNEDYKNKLKKYFIDIRYLFPLRNNIYDFKWYEEPKKYKPKRDFKKLLLKWLGWI